MEFRKATLADVPAVAEIYESCIAAEETGVAYTGWQRGVYPTADTARDAIAKGTLFVMTDESGEVTATAKFDHVQFPEYANGKWEHDAAPEEVLVMHTLAVDKRKSVPGRGLAFVGFYEQYARSLGIRELRIDTGVVNTVARRMYAKCGYKEVGSYYGTFQGIPNVELLFLEKYLD